MVKQYRQNRTTKENSTDNWEMTRKHTSNRLQKKPNDLWLKYGKKKKQKKKKTQRNGRINKQDDKRIRRTRRRPKSGNTHRFTQNVKTTLKDIKLDNARPWWNTWFLVQEIHLHSQQTSTRNEQMPSRSTCTRMDDQRKDHLDPKGSKQRNRLKLLQTHNLPTDD